MYDTGIDLEVLAERLAAVRRNYGESIDIPDLDCTAFATLLGISPPAYESYESGEREPSLSLLMALRNRTHISLDWFLDTNGSEQNRPLR